MLAGIEVVPATSSKTSFRITDNTIPDGVDVYYKKSNSSSSSDITLQGSGYTTEYYQYTKSSTVRLALDSQR